MSNVSSAVAHQYIADHKTMSNKSFIISTIILLVTIGAVTGVSLRGEPAVTMTNLEKLPMEISGFRAAEDFFSEAVYRELNADVHVYRHYRNAEGQQVHLYIGYYGTAKGGRTGHNPYACLSGAGWAIVDSRKVLVKAKHHPDGVNVSYILARRGDVYETVLHWYQSAGRKVLATGIQQNVQRFLGRVFLNRNEGAFVRVSAFSKGDDLDRSGRMAQSFAGKVLDLLPRYWPVEE